MQITASNPLQRARVRGTIEALNKEKPYSKETGREPNGNH